MHVSCVDFTRCGPLESSAWRVFEDFGTVELSDIRKTRCWIATVILVPLKSRAEIHDVNYATCRRAIEPVCFPARGTPAAKRAVF